MVIFFKHVKFLNLNFFYLVVAICDLVHEVETIFHLHALLTES